MRQPENNQKLVVVLTRCESHDFIGTVCRDWRKTVPSLRNIQREVPFRTDETLQFDRLNPGFLGRRRDGGQGDAGTPTFEAVFFRDKLESLAMFQDSPK